MISLQQELRSEIVSDASERLILVDADDVETGSLDKQSCHDGDGVLHRAFSLFIFNSNSELLLQQRSADKRLWPLFWSNSCCSHPRQGETMQQAVQRRCEQELGFTTPLQFVYKFEYQARYGASGSEHELCSVFVGYFDGQPDINTTEIESWRWCPPGDLDRIVNSEADNYTPWFKLEWLRLRRDYAHLLNPSAGDSVC